MGMAPTKSFEEMAKDAENPTTPPAETTEPAKNETPTTPTTDGSVGQGSLN